MKVKQTKSGKWWPCREPSGDVVRTGNPYGYETKEAAQKAAARIVSRKINKKVSPQSISTL